MAIKGSQIKHLTQATLKGTCASAVKLHKKISKIMTKSVNLLS